jgi:hypothetical protein
MLEIDLPDVLAERTAAFEGYKRALVGNDIQSVNRLFWDSPKAGRFGAREPERARCS